MNTSWRLEYSWAIIGAIAALLFSMFNLYGVDLSQSIETHKVESIFIIMLLGGLFAGFALPLARWLKPQAGRLGITSVSLAIPGVGPVEIKLSSAQRLAGWHVFIELATRIATHSLISKQQDTGESEISGSLRPAFNSLYSIFTTVRDELKAMPPSPPPVQQGQTSTFESYLSRVLNQDLRPFLSRWHPRLDDWEATGMPEDQWPLEKLCREDLERTRNKLLYTTWTLGTAIKIANLQDILPQCPAEEALQTLIDFKQINQQEQPLAMPLGNAQFRSGWNIFVEVSSRIPVNKLQSTQLDIQQTLSGLELLTNRIRRELKQMPPTPYSADEGETVEQLSLQLLNQDILPFVHYWQAQINDQIKLQKKAVHGSQQSQYHQDLMKLYQQLHSKMIRLGQLLGVRQLDSILPLGD